MSPRRARRKPPPASPDALWVAGVPVEPGQTTDVFLDVAERDTGAPVKVPVRVARGSQPGPTLLVTAAVHGDELNGVGIVRQLMLDRLSPERGALLLVPVVNVLGLEQRSRYLPDRRDLNRSFPGSARGSLTSRYAHRLFESLVELADYGIDLHTATLGRTNFPHVRADLSLDGMLDLAMAFGCELVVDHPGDRRSLRTAATRSGRPTLLLEAGEALKIEPSMVAIGARGVRNVMRHLGMIDGDLERPAYQTTSDNTRWLRAPTGGLLRFHVAPGDVVDAGAPLCSIDNLFSGRSRKVKAPTAGVVLALPTHPGVKPGDPLCHLATPSRPVADIRREVAASPGTLHRQAQAALGTGFGPPPEPT